MTSSEKGDIDLGSVENLDEGLSEEEKAEIVSARIIVLFSSPDFYHSSFTSLSSTLPVQLES